MFRFFSFFLLFTITDEDIRFASILYNFRSFHSFCFIFEILLEYTNSFYLRLWKCWANSLRFTSFVSNFGTTWCFCFILAKLKTKPNFFRFDLWITFVPFSFALMNCLTKPIRFRFDLQKFRNKQFVSFPIFMNFGLNLFLFRSSSSSIILGFAERDQCKPVLLGI